MARRTNKQIDEDDQSRVIGLGIIGVISYFIWLGHQWTSNRDKFWYSVSHTLIPIIVCIVLIVLAIIKFKRWRQNSKDRRIQNFIDTIIRIGFESEVKNFIARFSKEKKKNNWEYRGYIFDLHTLADFRKTLISKGVALSENNYDDITDVLTYFIDEIEKNFVNASISISKSNKFSDLNRTGDDFEHLIVRLCEAKGYSAKRVGGVGDQGADIIANKNGESLLIQAKCYENSVGNFAVQQAVAAKQHYGANKTAVITTSYFTNEAKALAESNGVLLLDKKDLQHELAEFLHESWE